MLKKKYDEEKAIEKIETEKKHKAEEAAKKERMESLKHVIKPDQIVNKQKNKKSIRLILGLV